MTAGWVAATTRGRALVGQLLGPDGARNLAESPWPDAQAALRTSYYGADLVPDADRRAARRTAINATTWQLRVLAGWLPPGRSALARLFAAPMEIANIEGHLARLDGRTTDPPILLGSLAAAWPRVAVAGSGDQIRTVLATSVWGDPGGSNRATIALGLRVAWARRISGQLPSFSAWARGATATLVAREQFGFGRPVEGPTSRVVDRLLGRRWRDASSIPELLARVPKSAAWPLETIDEPADLWRAEVVLTHRVRADAARLVASGGRSKTVVGAMMALLLVDLWQVLAAIEVAGRSPIPVGVFDAVA